MQRLNAKKSLSETKQVG